MLKAGDIAPDFELQNQRGEKLKLSHLCLKGKVVLFFYPKNETSVCTREACSFRDRLNDFSAVNAEVVGISGDSVKSHQSFAQNHSLNYQLLSDRGNWVRKQFGIPNNWIFIPGRVTYVIGDDRTILHQFESMRNHEAHIQTALEFLKQEK